MFGAGTLRLRSGELCLDSGTLVAGILNVTPDSFSDGGRFLEPQRAIDRALEMVSEGADLIDVGACSTRPGAEAVGPKEELGRLLPVVEKLARSLTVPLSIDTYHASVFRACYDAGAEILNDVTAFRGDSAMAPFIGDSGAPAILMHMQGDPQTMQEDPQYEDVVLDIKRFFSKVMERAERFGVSWSQTVLDPGIGFGKTLEQNTQILRRIDEFHELDRPLLVGTSRKSFLGKILEREDPMGREHATVATTAYLFWNQVQIVRVHDVRANVDALRILAQLRNETKNR